jgi:hypothetical protein
MVGPLLTAIMILFEVFVVLIMQRNQRPLSRSYSTRGSEIPAPLLTEVQKAVSATSKPPTTPVSLS